jgi:cysteine desulfurase family protein
MTVAPVYLDHASTSFPKPDVLWHAARDYLNDIGVSPGRGGYRAARQADRLLEQARSNVATLLGTADPSRIIFTANATHALNIAITGSLDAGDHVVTTSQEHNSVLRPLHALAAAGTVTYTVVDTTRDGVLDPAAVRAAMRPNTTLVVANHASNVTGAVAPVEQMRAIAHEFGATFLLDASQTLGVLDVDVEAIGADLVAFTGHKSLRGPSGTGGLYLRHPARVRPLLRGGTGVASQALTQPAAMPAKFESGTPNYLGIAGLSAAVELILRAGTATTRQRLLALRSACVDQLDRINGVTVYDVHPDLPRVPVIALNVDHLYPSELSAVLDEQFGVMTRAGLHCAPLVHRTLGTAPHGTVRISLGTTSTAEDVEALVLAVQHIADRVPVG